MLRHPAVAGQFYTDDPAQLRRELDRFIVSGERRRALGIISPHAGYVYSGAVAGRVFGKVEIPNTVLVLGPNHHGVGAPAALYPAGEWLLPNGRVAIDQRLSELILKHAPFVTEDPTAHRFEHSLEVQVPFLQHENPHVTIAAICLGFSDFRSCSALGNALAAAITEYGDPVLIVASSDMTHYESAAAAKEKDHLALQEIERLDPEALLKTCRARNITMCGVVPATVMLVAAKALGATSAQVISYASSGEVNGDYDRVVGYAAVAVC
ncbi:AmmeMemoRadiSam system protein B [Geomesophilobacter sediminis]|uniref:MEMO1 family protein JFN93_22700 n=1 Tax=Geomesophilobacter sediminis TaxID=2798584 RepID=A0A8J7M2H1_9BACT|nr:AmmeMemoRadiSam system protein B [Geomesophilobacter sediminis]MBJ6727534.1 AmmeMemoRadiSam system protein B [Geomesophilobacter sediminis]